MFRSPYSPQDDQNDHLRTLIDQRNARSDVHGRVSATMSEYSDTPSVYSHAYFSPRPSDNGDYYGGYPYSTPIPDSHSARTPRYDQQASMLDLDDDPRASYTSSEVYESPNETYDEEGDDSVVRMSYLGPKMRFHSRAPWEEDALVEEDETEDQHSHSIGFPFSRKTNSKSTTSGSSSPRPSFNTPSVARPSVESSNSRLSTKRSFETISSQMSYPRGALYALAQESMSATSLARQPPPPHKERLLNKFSLSRLRAEALTHSSSSSSSPLASPAVIRNPTPNCFTTPPATNARTSLRSASPDSFEYALTAKNTTTHPYANPDLVSSFTPGADEPNSSNGPPRSDSKLTVTESNSSDSMARSSTRTTSTSDTTSVSSVSVISRLRLPSLSHKGAASPPAPIIGAPKPLLQSASGLPLSNTPPNTPGIAGWSDRSPAGAPFALISLEEARAQRMRSSTASGVPISDLAPPFAGGGSESVNSGIESSSLSTFSNLASRARGRSISTGSKAGNVFQNKVGPPKIERRDSEPALAEAQPIVGPPPGRTLKNKKSGFMRLFNKEKDEESPPPVPSLPENVNQHQHLQHLQRTAKPVQRVPVPSISPSLEDFDMSQSTRLDVSLPDAQSLNKSPKRQPPPVLSISTISQGAQARASTIERPRRDLLDRPFVHNLPQSAPANVNEFPVLKLRPVSTMFSSQFGEHILPISTPRSSEETDISTPRSPSPSGLTSPLTPISLSRPSQDHARIAYIPSHSHTPDDHHVVRAMQDQMVSQKKAWQSRIWELESQVRDLKAEIGELKRGNGPEHECERCGRGRHNQTQTSASAGGGVVNRPRARTGTSSRFGNPQP